MSNTGKVYECMIKKKRYTIPPLTDDQFKLKDNVLEYVIINTVHTHPKEDVKFQKINTILGLTAQNLALSQSDIDKLPIYSVSTGYILSREDSTKKGYVFSFSANSLGNNSYCSIVGRF